MPENRRVLVSGAFLEDWVERSLALIEHYAGASGLEPLVLLPHDIQCEDYAPLYEVYYAGVAEAALERFFYPGCVPRLVFIDFAPEIHPGDECLLAQVNARLGAEWPAHSMIVVHAPSDDAIDVNAFDTHHHH